MFYYFFYILFNVLKNVQCKIKSKTYVIFLSDTDRDAQYTVHCTALFPEIFRTFEVKNNSMTGPNHHTILTPSLWPIAKTILQTLVRVIQCVIGNKINNRIRFTLSQISCPPLEISYLLTETRNTLCQKQN